MSVGGNEAELIAIARGAKPEGRARWTLELLAERIVEHCLPQTIMRTLVLPQSESGIP